MATNINQGHRYSVIDANPLALKVRDYIEAGLLSENEAAECLAYDDEGVGNVMAQHYAAERVDRVMSR
ncbi:MAG TPA: hypothetical protein PK999_16650 [Nitrospira sp.]|nr:hypothetical protein [Nitrospira sp.]